jgi:small subunit ribosomal protein S6
MRQYELTVIFPLEEDQHKAGREQLLADLAANGAEIEKTDETGDRDLAYPINKRTPAANTVPVLAEARTSKVVVLDRAFKLNPKLSQVPLRQHRGLRGHYGRASNHSPDGRLTPKCGTQVYRRWPGRV